MTDDLAEALRHYRNSRFTDADVTHCTGLSVRAWRELIKHRAVSTISEGRGRGRIRLCDDTVFKRAAVIAALNQAGLSLLVAGRIAYFLPLHTLLYSVIDPLTILFQQTVYNDPETGLPPLVQQPIVDWFDPAKPATVDRQTDWLIEIYDGRFVAVLYDDATKDQPIIFGDLRDHGTRFVAWRRKALTAGAIGNIARHLLGDQFIHFIEDWEDPTKATKELSSLGYEFEDHDMDDAVFTAAKSAIGNPLVKTTINVSLVLRKALRRYLRIEPDPLKESTS